MNFIGKKCARVKARQSRKKMGSQKRGEKKERANGIAQQNWTENQMRPCVDCAESFHAIFCYDWELAIEIRELIPINFIAPVRLFSRYTMAKWGNEWTDSDLYICFRRDTSCSGLRSLHSKNHHSSFFLICSSTKCSFETQTVMNIKSDAIISRNEVRMILN